jgi:hypothetical protein
MRPCARSCSPIMRSARVFPPIALRESFQRRPRPPSMRRLRPIAMASDHHGPQHREYAIVAGQKCVHRCLQHRAVGRLAGAVDGCTWREPALGRLLQTEATDFLPFGQFLADFMIDGDMDAGAWSCGMAVGLIHDVPTVKELVDRIMVDAERLIRVRLVGFLDTCAPACTKVA